MKLSRVKKCLFIFSSILILNSFFFNFAFSASDPFPAYEEAPHYTTYFADGVPNHVWHIRLNGSDSTGDGTYANAWASLAGGQGTIAAGDLVLFHEGNYTSYTHGSEDGGSWHSTNYCTTPGSSNDRIVIIAANKYAGYSSENVPVIISTGNELCTTDKCMTGEENIASDYGMGMTLAAYQVVDGIHFQTCISTADENVVMQNCEFSVGGSGQRDGNSANILIPGGSESYNIDIRNNIFHDPIGFHDQDTGGSHSYRCYAVILFSTVSAGNGVQIKYNKFYNWNTTTSTETIIYLKDTAHGVEVAHNRFYNSDAFAVAGFGQSTVNSEGLSVHHNLVHNCAGLWWGWGEGIGAEWYNNVVMDNGYTASHSYGGGNTYGLMGLANSHTCNQPWGEVWNNIFSVDVPGRWIDDGGSTAYGWPIWVDYNAYVSAGEQSDFENSSDGTTNWQQHDQTSIPAITVDSNYFATVADNYPYKTAGRNGDCIGGFTFGGSGGDTTPPSAPSGLSVN